jgi:Tfp pilus assembly protein PilE
MVEVNIVSVVLGILQSVTAAALIGVVKALWNMNAVQAKLVEKVDGHEKRLDNVEGELRSAA